MLGLSLALPATRPQTGFNGTLAAQGSKPVFEFRQYQVQSDADVDYAVKIAADGTNQIRFELKNGDIATSTGGHRAEISGLPFRYLPAERITACYAMMIEPGALLTSWMLVGQIHQDDNVGDSPPFAIELDTDDTLLVKTRNNAGTQTIHGQTVSPIRRGAWYRVFFDILLGGSTGADTLVFTLTDADGVDVLDINLTGLNIGYTLAAHNYIKFGVYGDSTAGGDAIAMRLKNISVGIDGASYIDIAANDPPRAVQGAFLDGITAPTWGFAPGMKLLSSWTTDIAEMDTAVGRYSYIYDQTGNNWGLSQATEANQPLREFPGDQYVLGAYFEGGGDLMTVDVDNDTSDLIGSSGFYIMAILDIVGVPANDVLDPANNNPLVFGENSGARNFGITTRDDGDGSPHDIQFFVKDSGGEKVATVQDVLPDQTRVLVEAEHTGTAIRIRVNGGAWSTTAAGAIAVMTGFPRVGHCGTSYQGRLYALATWKTPPSDPERATILSRFNALPS